MFDCWSGAAGKGMRRVAAVAAINVRAMSGDGLRQEAVWWQKKACAAESSRAQWLADMTKARLADAQNRYPCEDANEMDAV